MQITDFSHLELNTNDLAKVLSYFAETLGMPLYSLDWANAKKTAVRAFLKLNDQAMLSFLFRGEQELEDKNKAAMGVSHAGNAANPSAKGTLQHIAFNVDSVDELVTIRNRIRASGTDCMGPLDHGFCWSIYFAGPENMTLEVCTTTRDDLDKWIVSDAAKHAGVSQETVAKLR